MFPFPLCKTEKQVAFLLSLKCYKQVGFVNKLCSLDNTAQMGLSGAVIQRNFGFI